MTDELKTPICNDAGFKLWPHNGPSIVLCTRSDPYIVAGNETVHCCMSTGQGSLIPIIILVASFGPWYKGLAACFEAPETEV